MRALVLGQITRIRTGKVAEPALMRLLIEMQGRDVRLQLRVRGSRVPAVLADVGPVAGVGALVVVFCLVRGEGLGAAFEAACVGPVACVSEEVA